MIWDNQYIVYQLTELIGGLLLSIIGISVLLSSFLMKGSEPEIISVQLLALLCAYIGAIKVAPHVDELITWLYATISKYIYRLKTK